MSSISSSFKFSLETKYSFLTIFSENPSISEILKLNSILLIVSSESKNLICLHFLSLRRFLMTDILLLEFLR